MAEKFADLLGKEYKAEVLKFLKDNPDDFFSINEITEKTSGTNPSVKKFLEELSDIGLVKFRKKAGSYLVEYNQNSKYDRAIKEMLRAEIRDLVHQADWYAKTIFDDQDIGGDVVSIILYGSVARGTADSNSDIDILILVKNNVDEERIMDRSLEIARKRSNEQTEIVPIVEKMGEFKENLHSTNRFESSVFDDGEVLKGKELGEFV